jgi:hypothetical protein
MIAVSTCWPVALLTATRAAWKSFSMVAVGLVPLDPDRGTRGERAPVGDGAELAGEPALADQRHVVAQAVDLRGLELSAECACERSSGEIVTWRR